MSRDCSPIDVLGWSSSFWAFWSPTPRRYSEPDWSSITARVLQQDFRRRRQTITPPWPSPHNRPLGEKQSTWARLLPVDTTLLDLIVGIDGRFLGEWHTSQRNGSSPRNRQTTDQQAPINVLDGQPHNHPRSCCPMVGRLLPGGRKAQRWEVVRLLLLLTVCVVDLGRIQVVALPGAVSCVEFPYYYTTTRWVDKRQRRRLPPRHNLHEQSEKGIIPDSVFKGLGVVVGRDFAARGMALLDRSRGI